MDKRGNNMDDIETLDFEENNKNKNKRKLKKWVKALITFIIMVVIIIALFFALGSYLLSAPSNTTSVIEFTVTEGKTVDQVGKQLEKEGIIRNFLAYKVYVRLKKVNGYKAGIYKLDKSYNTMDIVEILTSDYYKEKSINITFKEGKTIKDVAREVAKKTDITESEFYEKLDDDSYIDLLIQKYWFLTDSVKNENIYYPLEGYLFPDTYSFKENVKPEDIIETMLNQTQKIFDKYKSQIDLSSYNINELVTLASVVEKEGIYKDDRKQIAGVFYNRLNAGMQLGSDVTTYYAFKIDLGERNLTKAEINTYNPYNTRGPEMAGKLPVGAICNFGITSFEAVLNPASSDYYYFVADKSGKTHFTKTYEEHQKVINDLKKQGNWLEL